MKSEVACMYVCITLDRYLTILVIESSFKESAFQKKPKGAGSMISQ